MKESKFQAELISELKQMFPECFVLKNDAGYIQGIPDLTILYGEKWATLECKKSAKANIQPNQKYYVALLNSKGFSAFIFPENKKKVLSDLYVYFMDAF